MVTIGTGITNHQKYGQYPASFMVQSWSNQQFKFLTAKPTTIDPIAAITNTMFTTTPKSLCFITLKIIANRSLGTEFGVIR